MCFVSSFVTTSDPFQNDSWHQAEKKKNMTLSEVFYIVKNTVVTKPNESLHTGAISWLEHGSCVCKGHNPLTDARGLSSLTDAQPYSNYCIKLPRCVIYYDNRKFTKTTSQRVIMTVEGFVINNASSVTG